ncbi:MAG: transglutaminase family protein [Lysinibacillus sp.]
MILQSDKIEDYLEESLIINFSNSSIQQLIEKLFHKEQSDVEKIQTAFHYVRDDIKHSWDIQSEKVTCTADEVLEHKQGICYAKSNLLAALLRSQRIPTGFCYQRLMLFDTPEKGYCIHALNAVYIQTLDKWFRLDARGNKKGVDAQFSLTEEKIAFSVNEKLGEIDYPIIYTAPNEKTIDILKKSKDALKMYVNDLPVSI